MRAIPLPGKLVIPLTFRTESAPLAVSVGTIVRRGDVLAAAKPLGHSPLAPAAGRVGNTVTISLVDGRRVPGVELFTAADQTSKTGSVMPPPPELSGRSGLGAWIDRLRGAGVWADRRSCPDLLGQLNQVLARPIEVVMCSLIDSDPMARLQSALAARHAKAVLAGANLLARMTGARVVALAVETEAPQNWLGPICTLAEDEKMEVLELQNDYPHSDPSLLLHGLMERRLKPGLLPPTQGVLLVDAVAAIAVSRTMSGEPMLTTPIAVHDHAHRGTLYFTAPIGASSGDVLQSAGIDSSMVTIRSGDLLRDLRADGSAVVAGSEVVLHATAAEASVNPDPCIRCGWCLQACPTRVQPAMILDAAQRQDRAMAERAGIHACVECGICSYVCPSRLPILQAIRSMRQAGA